MRTVTEVYLVTCCLFPLYSDYIEVVQCISNVKRIWAVSLGIYRDFAFLPARTATKCSIFSELLWQLTKRPLSHRGVVLSVPACVGHLEQTGFPAFQKEMSRWLGLVWAIGQNFNEVRNAEDKNVKDKQPNQTEKWALSASDQTLAGGGQKTKNALNDWSRYLFLLIIEICNLFGLWMFV